MDLNEMKQMSYERCFLITLCLFTGLWILFPHFTSLLLALFGMTVAYGVIKKELVFTFHLLPSLLVLLYILYLVYAIPTDHLPIALDFLEYKLSILAFFIILAFEPKFRVNWNYVFYSFLIAVLLLVIYDLAQASIHYAKTRVLNSFYSPASLQDELMKMPGWEIVNDFGNLSRDKIIEVLNNSKIGIVTLYPQANYLESLTIKMFEYMLAGMPVIASNFPLWNDIIKSADCGLTIDPQSPEEITSAIQIVLSNDDRAKQMGENGRKAVIEKYNWAIEEEKLVLFYQQLTNEGKV